jgi:hypothetical protein
MPNDGGAGGIKRGGLRSLKKGAAFVNCKLTKMAEGWVHTVTKGVGKTINGGNAGCSGVRTGVLKITLLRIIRWKTSEFVNSGAVGAFIVDDIKCESLEGCWQFFEGGFE